MKSDTVLVELSNPEVEQDAFDAEWQLKGAEAQLANVRAQLDADKLNEKKAVATAEADYSSAKLEFEVEEELATNRLVPQLTLTQAKAKAEELAKLLEIEHERMDAGIEAAKAQLGVKRRKSRNFRPNSH